MTLRIELDSVRKHRNANEWRTVGRASCQGHELIGDGAKIADLCRILLSEGHSGPVEVWRGQTPVFAAMDLETWASGKALRGEQPEQLRKQA